MSSKLPEPMSRTELLALPPVIDMATAARALGKTYRQACKMAKAGAFPLKPMPQSDRRRLYKTAELHRLLGVGPDTAVTSPASGTAERGAA